MENKEITSKITGKTYNLNDVVKILNVYQAAAYLSCEAELLDIYTSPARGSNKPLIIFIFDRADTQVLYDLWCKHQLL